MGIGPNEPYGVAVAVAVAVPWEMLSDFLETLGPMTPNVWPNF